MKRGRESTRNEREYGNKTGYLEGPKERERESYKRRQERRERISGITFTIKYFMTTSIDDSQYEIHQSATIRIRILFFFFIDYLQSYLIFKIIYSFSIFLNFTTITLHLVFHLTLYYLISSHPISSHLILSHLILSYLISFHLISSHLILSHLISSHLILSHFISSHLISSYLISSHLISSYHISSYLISFHLISSYLILSHLILSHLISSHLI
jgi:hypothetical protein